MLRAPFNSRPSCQRSPAILSTHPAPDLIRDGDTPSLRAVVKLMRLTSERLSTMRTGHRVAEGNCAAERRGGEQPEANLSSQRSLSRRLNPIRPFGMASPRRTGEALVDDQPEANTKPVSSFARESEGGWGEKAGKARQISNEILSGAEESGWEVRASIVAGKRVMIVEPREVGR